MCVRASPRDLADKPANAIKVLQRSGLSRNQFLGILSRYAFTVLERDRRITAVLSARFTPLVRNETGARFFLGSDWDRIVVYR